MKSINKISPVWLFCCSVIPVPTALADVLENPQPGSAQSGISLISGWVCNASHVDVVIDGNQTYPVAYGTERTDTQPVCGDTNNGFGFLFNYNKLGDGQHTIQALADGVEFGRATFTVTTLGQEYLQGATRTFELPDFPSPGTTLTLVWQEHLQNFTIAGKKNSGASSITPGLYTGVTSQGNGCSLFDVHPNDSCEVRLNIQSIDGDRVALSPSPQVDFWGGMSSQCGGQAGVGEPVSFMAVAHCPIGSCAGGQCPVLFYICSTIELNNGGFNYAGIIHGNCANNVCSGTINGGASCSFS